MEVFPAGEALLDVSLSSFDCMVLYKKFLFNLFIGVSAEAWVGDGLGMVFLRICYYKTLNYHEED